MEYLLVNYFYNMGFDSEIFVQQTGSIVGAKCSWFNEMRSHNFGKGQAVLDF